MFCRNLSLLSICTHAPLKVSGEVWLCSVAVSLCEASGYKTVSWSVNLCLPCTTLVSVKPLKADGGKSGEVVFMGLGRLSG